MTVISRLVPRLKIATASFLATACFLAGCGGGQQRTATAPVSGTITYQGEPVTGGSLTFFPLENPNLRPASGEVKSDGTFFMETYGNRDGAAIGRVRISYSPPLIDNADAKIDYDAPLPKPPFADLVPKEAEVDIESGKNQIEIELTEAAVT